MQALRCAECKRFIVVEAGGITDGGLWFHTHCYRVVVNKKIIYLEGLKAFKSITEKQEQELQRLSEVWRAL